ncbi:MAG: hypothetical protein ACYTAF_05565 [Planctomycetota bacterium]|jgi:hypothetical protein
MKRVVTSAAVVLVAAAVLVPFLARRPETKKPQFEGLVLPESLAAHGLYAKHPALRWLKGNLAEGFLRPAGDGTWEPTRRISSFEIRDTLTYRTRAGAKLPDGNPVTPKAVSVYLSRIGSRLALDPRTKGLSLQVGGEGGGLVFSSAGGHEDLSLALGQLLPDILVGDPVRRTDIVLGFAEPARAEEYAALLREEARRQEKADFPDSHLFRKELKLEVRDGKCVVRADGCAGRMLRVLCAPLFVRAASEGFPLVVVGKPGEGAAYFTTDPPAGTERVATGRRLLVVGIFNVRSARMRSGPRHRLVRRKADVSDVNVDILVADLDVPALEEAWKLQARWRNGRARVRVHVLGPEEYGKRRGEWDYDVLVRSVPEEFFEDPYPFWYSRGADNVSGATIGEIDGLILRLDEAVSPKGRRALVEELRTKLASEALVEVLREKELYLCGKPEVVGRILGALKPE